MINSKAKRIILISVLALLLVAAIVLATIFFPFGKDKKPSGDKNKKPGNTVSDIVDDTDDDFDDIEMDDDFDYDFEDEEDNLIYLNEFDYFSHLFTYPANMEEDGVLLVNRIYLAAHEKYTTLAPPTTDKEPLPEAQVELLIGDTNRQLSKDAKALLEKNKNKNANDFVILEKDGNIAINALSTAALEKAVDYFIETFMSDDYPEMEKGYCYVYQKSPVVKTAQIAGVDFRQWKIVVPNGCSYIYTRYLYSAVDAIREATGYEIPICFDTKTSASAYEILVGNTNRSESTAVADRDSYYIKQEGTKLVINGGHTYSLSRATKAFYDAVNKAVEKKSEKLIPVNMSLNGKYEESDTDYNIAFADEFDDDSLSNWINRPGYLNTVTGIATGGTVSFAEDERVRYVKDGKLVFKFHTEDLINWVQSPELVSRDRVTYDYGYLEMKAKLPKGSGVYPGFWVARNYTAYPNSPEIDLMEQFGVDNQFAANVHLWWYVPDATNKLVSKHINKGDAHWFARKITLPKGETLNDEWHTYGCEITEDAIRFYFDGIKFGEYSLNKDRMDMFAQLKEIRIGYNKIGVNSTIPMPDKTTVSEFEVEYIHIHQTKNLGQIADHF